MAGCAAWISTPSSRPARPTGRGSTQLVRQRRRTGAEADELVRLYQAVADRPVERPLGRPRPGDGDPAVDARRARPGRDRRHPRAQLARRHGVRRGLAAGGAVPDPLVDRGRGRGVRRARGDRRRLGGHAARGARVDGHAQPSSRSTSTSRSRSTTTPGAGFAAMVWTNNAWLTAVCIGTGITGVLPVYFQASNAINVGAAGGLMAAHGHLDVFLQLIAPHGLLELTAVFVAGAAGLRLFWTWLDPGPRPRGRALAEEGRALFTVAIGLVGVLAVSGLIEGFVTGSGLPWAVKVEHRRRSRWRRSGPTRSSSGAAPCGPGRRATSRPTARATCWRPRAEPGRRRPRGARRPRRP